jgi:hypothetical protein
MNGMAVVQSQSIELSLPMRGARRRGIPSMHTKISKISSPMPVEATEP